jgi:predicted RNase H-like nuclease (RuvC/YqgF family)
VSYHWKDESISKNLDLGFIAQDLLKTIPEAVVTTEVSYDKDGVASMVPVKNLGVKYDVLIPVLTKGIQEQQSTIEHLTIEVEQLKKQLNEYSSMMLEIKALKADLQSIKTKLSDK